jgi:D-beta-D-heptose 7-phosphate kinase/D-beta-D-heptose 1-phosphate adenosyltransferase
MAKIIVNGTFDILHRGHLSMLQYARNQGDYLLVCIDTDKRVQELKGPQRPINCQEDRKYMLESLRCVDEVQFFGSDADLIDIIKKYKPDIMVKGDDYQNRAVVGQQYIPTMLFYERTNHSTTQTIQDIIAR